MLSYVSAGPRKETPRYVDVCLVDAMRALSFKVPYTGNGPFWALADGSCFVKPWGCLNRFHPLHEGFYFLFRYKYIVVQNLIFSFQPSLALRQRLNRVQEADLSASADVKLVVHGDSHFIAVRCLEGAWQVNFTNKTHKWQEAVLTRRAEDKRSFWKKGNVWMINLSTVSFSRLFLWESLGARRLWTVQAVCSGHLAMEGPNSSLMLQDQIMWSLSLLARVLIYAICIYQQIVLSSLSSSRWQ